jgi:hypothetical protein
MDVRLLTRYERDTLARVLSDASRDDRSVRVAWDGGLKVKVGGGAWELAHAHNRTRFA